MAGKIKWARIIKKEPYECRSAILVIAKDIWQGSQKELAELLDVNPNSLEQFFYNLKNKIRNGELDLQKLKSHGNFLKHQALQFYSFCQHQFQKFRNELPIFR